MSRTRAAAALPSVIGGPGSDFTGASQDTEASETRGRIPLCGPICWALVAGSDAREDTIYSLHDQRIPRSVRSSIKVVP